MSVSPEVDSAATVTQANSDVFATSVALDGCLWALAKEQTPNLRKRQRDLALEAYCRATLEFAGIDHKMSSTSPVELCFSQAHTLMQRQKIAVSLLRLISAYPDFTTHDGMNSGQVASLFDEILSGPLYAQAKINRNDQTFQKQAALSGLLRNLEAELSTLVKSLTGLQQLNAFRQAYLKRLRSGLSKFIIQPFLPIDVGDQRIEQLMAAIQSYLDADDASVVRLYEEAQGMLSTYLNDVGGVHITYLEQYCVEVAVKLRDLLSVHFASTSFSRPAELRPSLGGKKYPLSQDGGFFEIVLEIHNLGPGYAHEVTVQVKPVDDIEIDKESTFVGGMHPAVTTLLIPSRVSRRSETCMIEVICRWRNQDGEVREQSEPLELTAQRSDVNWERAATEDPYSLAPIKTADELIGRTEILNRLIALTKGANVESAYIRGQKRVGKTSIARALTSSLRNLFSSDYIVVYLEAGDYVTDNGRGTIQSLGMQLCKAVIRADTRFSSLNLPTFEGALSPITDFLQDAI